MAKKKKLEFDVQKGGETIRLKVKRPSTNQRQAADLISKKRYAEAVRAGVLIAAQLDKHIRESGLWTDAEETEYQRLRKVVLSGETKLKQGGRNGLTKAQARDVALEMVDARRAMSRMLGVQYAIQDNTAEAVANQAQTEFLIAACTYYADGPYVDQPYFAKVEDYTDRAEDEDANTAAENFYKLVYAPDEDAVEKKTPEEEFLFKYGFIDDKGRYLDKDGRFVDRKGRLVDDEGYLIDGESRRIDEDGVPIAADEDAFVEFLDD